MFVYKRLATKTKLFGPSAAATRPATLPQGGRVIAQPGVFMSSQLGKPSSATISSARCG